MSEAKHTQGPWVVTEEWSQPTGNCYSIEREREPERAANLRLIAAAPDLLAACEMCNEICEDGDTGAPFARVAEAMQAAAAAIAKAEGRA